MNNKRYAETKFDGEDDEEVSRSSRYNKDDSTSSDSSSSDEDDVDKAPSARSTEFSVYEIDEAEGEDSREVSSQFMGMELSKQDDYARDGESGHDGHTEEQFQGQGYEEEPDINLEEDSNEGENRLEGPASMVDNKSEDYRTDEGGEFQMNGREEEGSHPDDNVAKRESEESNEHEQNYQEDSHDDEKSGDEDEKFNYMNE